MCDEGKFKQVISFNFHRYDSDKKETYIYIYLHDIDLTRFVLDILKNSILSHTLVLKHMSKNTTL